MLHFSVLKKKQLYIYSYIVTYLYNYIVLYLQFVDIKVCTMHTKHVYANVYFVFILECCLILFI